MARFLTITHSNIKHSGQRKRAWKMPRKLGKLTLIFVLLGLVCFSGVLYVMQVNKLATMGFYIKEKEQAILSLRNENENLEIKTAQLRSITTIESAKENLKMIKPTQVSSIEMNNVSAMKTQ